MGRISNKTALKKKANMSQIRAEIKKLLVVMRKKGIPGNPFLRKNKPDGIPDIKADLLCFQHGNLLCIVDYSRGSTKMHFVVFGRDGKLPSSYEEIYAEIDKFHKGEPSVITSLYDPTREKRPGPWITLAMEIMASLQAAIRMQIAKEEIEKWRAFEDAKVAGNTYLNRRGNKLPKTCAIP